MADHRPVTEPGITIAHLEDRDLMSMFRATLSRHPTRTMIRYFDGELTFQRIDEESEAFAAALESRGFTHGDRLAIVANNIPHFVITMIAAWKLGGIIVPIPPALGDHEILELVSRSGASTIACEEARIGDWMDGIPLPTPVISLCPHEYHDAGSEELIPQHAAPRADTVEFRDLVNRHRGEPVAMVVPHPASAAAIVFTSGTTGAPKGAVNRHESLAFVGQVYRDWVALTEHDRVLEAAPFPTIMGIAAGIAPAIVTGCSVSISYRFHVATLARMARQHRTTFLMGAPTMYLSLLNEPSIRREDLESLNHLYCGASTVPMVLVERWRSRFGQQIGTAYGMTEASGPTHLSPAGVEVPIDPASGALAIGMPVYSTESRIVDPASQPGDELPEGEVGEMVVRGPQMISRYWNSGEDAAGTIADGWIRTGDLAIRRGDWFYVLDRIKDTIVTSGNNISPRQVEDCLLQHPSVVEAAVVGVPDGHRGESVQAFVVVDRSLPVTAEELIEHCRNRLASYKAPRVVRFIESLPVNLTGKVLRRHLRELVASIDS
ncbi:class I adenylate-forming enzyme family protein [Herbiconiux ginsengi]|uniref:Long-chain acyl-CoA synthetase n=1 Tax=Herbiconiux ginsengi TaxID=381665 RepID=A0A1H3TGQ5_9MICO|nr:AMP-binding protein [Herbiconiux ginsengi]SDZ48845.1 long-chain acyl-CoA synthetase [Herbiconiux ginsengi]